MGMTLESGLERILENKERFPMSNRGLAALVEVNFMTIFNHARKANVRPNGIFPYGYGFEEAQRIWQSVRAPRPVKPKSAGRVRVHIELEQKEWDAFRLLAGQEHLIPHMLAYKLVAKYIAENKVPLF